MIGTLINRADFDRAQIKAEMAKLPPIPADDLAFAVANADLIRDDYAAAVLEVIDATEVGKKQKIMRIGVGAAAGLVLGIVGSYVVRSL